MAGGKMRCERPLAAISRDRCHQRVWSGQFSGSRPDMFLGQNLLERERKETRSRLKTALFFPVLFRSKSFLNGLFFRFFPFLRLVSRFSSFFPVLASFKPFTPFKPRPRGPKFGICERVLNATRSKPVPHRSRNRLSPFTKSFKDRKSVV